MDYLPNNNGSNGRPVHLILDTDMGNDIDDALALAMIHALESRGECRLLGVALSKDNAYAPVYVDIINTFYSRGEIPIGVVENGVTPDDGSYARQVAELNDEGKPRYERTRAQGEYPEAVGMLRGLLADEQDASVVLVMIGFSTNLARLLESPADGVCDLNGRDLFKKKVSHVIMMAADFSDEARANPSLETREFNILKDIPSARAFIAGCPTPIIFTGLEVGCALMYPGSQTEHLYNWTPNHPVAEAYRHYRAMPYDRPSWDLTAVLQAVRPGAGYFGQSESGRAVVDDEGVVRFVPDPDGPHRYLTLIGSQQDRVIKAMVDLVTQPSKPGEVHIAARLARDPRQRPGLSAPHHGRVLTGSDKDTEST